MERLSVLCLDPRFDDEPESDSPATGTRYLPRVAEELWFWLRQSSLYMKATGFPAIVRARLRILQSLDRRRQTMAFDIFRFEADQFPPQAGNATFDDPALSFE